MAKILNRGSTLAERNTAQKIFEGFVYIWKRDGLKVSTFGPILTPLFLLKIIKIEKKAVVRSNFSH